MLALTPSLPSRLHGAARAAPTGRQQRWTSELLASLARRRVCSTGLRVLRQHGSTRARQHASSQARHAMELGTRVPQNHCVLRIPFFIAFLTQGAKEFCPTNLVGTRERRNDGARARRRGGGAELTKRGAELAALRARVPSGGFPPTPWVECIQTLCYSFHERDGRGANCHDSESIKYSL